MGKVAIKILQGRPSTVT